MPAFAFEKVASHVTMHIGPYTVLIECKGTLRTIPLKKIVNFSVTNFNQLALPAEHEVTVVVGQIVQSVTSSVEMTIDPKTFKPTLSPTVTIGVTLDGKNWQEASVTPVPMGVRVGYKRRSLLAKQNDLQIEGEVALEVTVTLREPKKQPQEIELVIRAPSPQDVLVAAGVAVLIAAAFVASAPAMTFAAAAIALGVIPYDKWKGNGSGGTTTPEI